MENIFLKINIKYLLIKLKLWIASLHVHTYNQTNKVDNI